MLTVIKSDDDMKIYDNEKHFKVFAGPGAGKTHLIIENIKCIIHNSPKINHLRNILCITYTNIAADEIIKRLNNYKEYTSVSTIHSFLYQNVIKPYQKQLKILIKEKYKIDIKDSLQMKIRRDGDTILAGSSVESVRIWLTDNESVDLTIALGVSKNTITNCVLTYKEKNKYPFELDDYIPALKENKIPYYVAILIKKYLWGKLGVIDFDEILYFSYELIKKHKFIGYNLRYKFPYVFIDEQQDTNPIQYEIIKLIFDNKDNSVGFVGDIAQSIYSFQGADYRMLENESFKSKEQLEYVIEGNRRSTENIIHFCNFIRQKDKKLSKQNCVKNFKSNKKVKILVITKQDKNLEEFIDKDTIVICRRFIDLFKYVDVSCREQSGALIRLYREYTYTYNKDLFNEFEDESYDWIKKIKFVCNIFKAIKNRDFATIINELEKHLNIRDVLKPSSFQVQNYKKIQSIVNSIEVICENGDICFSEILSKIDDLFNDCGLEYINKICDKESDNDFELFDVFTLNTIFMIGNEIYVSDSRYKTIHKSKGKEYSKVLIDFKPSEISEKGINAIEVITNPIIYTDNDNLKIISEFTRIFYVGISRAMDELTVVLDGNSEQAKKLEHSLLLYCEKENIKDRFYEIIVL